MLIIFISYLPVAGAVRITACITNYEYVFESYQWYNDCQDFTGKKGMLNTKIRKVGFSIFGEI